MRRHPVQTIHRIVRDSSEWEDLHMLDGCEREANLLSHIQINRSAGLRGENVGILPSTVMFSSYFISVLSNAKAEKTDAVLHVRAGQMDLNTINAI